MKDESEVSLLAYFILHPSSFILFDWPLLRKRYART